MDGTMERILMEALDFVTSDEGRYVPAEDALIHFAQRHGLDEREAVGRAIELEELRLSQMRW